MDNRGRYLLTPGAEALPQLARGGEGGVKWIKIRAGLHSLVTSLQFLLNEGAVLVLEILWRCLTRYSLWEHDTRLVQ